MNQHTFACLYLHANSLAELGGERFSDLAAADDGAATPFDAAMQSVDASASPGGEAGRQVDDFDAYLRRLYATAEPLAPRIAAALDRLDVEGLQQLSARLPPHLPSLLAPLDGPGLSAWLALYEQGDENLLDIVQRIRCIDA